MSEIIKGKSFQVHGFFDRFFRVLFFNSHVYDEVIEIRTTAKQAFLLVVLSSLAGGAGLLMPNATVEIFLRGFMAFLFGWLAWVFGMYWAGAKIVAGPLAYVDARALLMAAGFASAPGIIRIAGIYPPFRAVVFLTALIWTLITMTIAVRRAMNYSSLSDSIFVALAGCVSHVAIMFIIMKFNKLI